MNRSRQKAAKLEFVHLQSNADFTTYKSAVQKTSSPFGLVEHANGTYDRIHHSEVKDAEELDSVLDSMEPSRISAMSWVMRSSGYVAVTKIWEGNMSRLCKELTGSFVSRSESVQSHLMLLPDELLLKIVKQLDATGLYSMGKTCRRMRRIVQDHTLIK